AAVLSAPLREYRFLHFATHGSFGATEPGGGRLALAQVDPQGRPEPNGFLYLADIYELSLRSDLVVLSACESALGKEVRGEGMMGMTRGFFYAGAERVLVSLWNVSDGQATVELMRHFYRGILTEGLSPAAALQKARNLPRFVPGLCRSGADLQRFVPDLAGSVETSAGLLQAWPGLLETSRGLFLASAGLEQTCRGLFQTLPGLSKPRRACSRPGQVSSRPGQVSSRAGFLLRERVFGVGRPAVRSSRVVGRAGPRGRRLDRRIRVHHRRLDGAGGLGIGKRRHLRLVGIVAEHFALLSGLNTSTT
ncbi:MAG: hypothetical protein DMF53_28620, partial [Acidobacteria bacterium]